LDRRLEKGRGMRCLHNGNVCRQPKTAAKNKFAYLDEEESENCIKYFPGQMSESKSQKGAAKKWQKIKKSKLATGNAFQSVWPFAMLAELIFDIQINFF